MEAQILELLRMLKRYPGTFMRSPVNFENYVAFISGLFSGVRFSNGIRYEREISEWYQSRVAERASNMVWFDQFNREHQKENDYSKSILLLDTLIEFFEQYRSSD
ncbi:MAG: hypothetical protein AAF998_28740 [Bacteroidota bacterium]